MVARPYTLNPLPGIENNVMHQLTFRIAEFCLVLLLVPVLAPLWLCHWLAARLQGRPYLCPRHIVAEGGKVRRIWEASLLSGFGARFFNSALVRFSPRLAAVLAGRISLVGPGMLSPAEAEQLSEAEAARFGVKPGLVSGYFLRQSVNIAFADERTLALADAQLTSPLKKAAMCGRGLVALLLRGGGGRDCDSLEMFGLKMVNETRQAAVERVVSLAEAPERARIAFVNPGCVNIAVKDPSYRAVLDASDVVFPDGIGIKIACRYLGLHMRDNLNGTDLFPAICTRLEHTDHGIYLLGAKPGVVDDMVEVVRKKWPLLRISGSRHGYFNSPEDEQRAITEINDSGASLLFVAMGVPGQELWIDRVWDQLTVRVALGVGGLFDFVSGRIPRAPLWVREIGMEWCYRLIREPRRLWRRYVIGNIVFLWHLVRCHK